MQSSDFASHCDTERQRELDQQVHLTPRPTRFHLIASHHTMWPLQTDWFASADSSSFCMIGGCSDCAINAHAIE